MSPRRFICAILVLVVTATLSRAQNTIPAPSWKPGSVFYYSVHLKTSRDIKTKSSVALPEVPNEAKIDVSGILQVEVLPGDPAVASAAARFHTRFLYLLSDIGALQSGKKPDQFNIERAPADNKYVDCVLQPGGQISQIAGLDQLAAEQQGAWREWATQFSEAYLAGIQAHKRGAKWDSDQPETSPSPIAQLRWKRKSQYVHDQLCVAAMPDAGIQQVRSAAFGSCAVILTTASLVQESSQQDSTPEDYKLRGLRTRGTAKGTNETILYISRKTGQLIRATQNAKQQMDVQIALADGSSQVHYSISADANASVELVTELPFNPHPNP